MNLDPEAVEKCITPHTKAMLVVHLAGSCSDMDPILELARNHDLYVIENNAQAPGAVYNGKYAGTLGHIGIFSLNCHKTIQAGEGGIAVTDDDDLALRLQLVRNHGEKVIPAMGLGNKWNLLGFNFRMTEMQAAIAIHQLGRLEHLSDWNARLAKHLTKRLTADFPFITPPHASKGSTHVYYFYHMEYDADAAGMPLELFAEAVCAEGVPVHTRYPVLLYRQPVYQNRSAIGGRGYPFAESYYDGNADYSDGICPQAEALADRSIYIDTLVRYPNTTDDMDRIADTFSKVMKFRKQIVEWSEQDHPADTSKLEIPVVDSDKSNANPKYNDQPKQLQMEDILGSAEEEIVEDDEHTVVVALATEPLISAMALASVAEYLMERHDVELHMGVADLGIQVFRDRFRTELQEFDPDEGQKFRYDAQVGAWLDEIKPEVVISGLVGAKGGLDYALQRQAKQRDIRTCALLESWDRLDDRLNDDQGEAKFGYLPDKLGVPDFTTALELSELGVDKEHLQLVGHPLHSDLKQLINRWRQLRDKARRWLEVEKGMDLVVFFSEPISDSINFGSHLNTGYDEFVALNVTASGLAKLYQKNACVLAVKEDPRKRTFGSRLKGGEVGGVRIMDITDSTLSDVEWILAADVVVGMSSQILVHSACTGIHTIAVQPNLEREYDSNPLTRRGLLPNIEFPEELMLAIRDFDEHDKRSLARVRKEFRWNENAAENVGKMVVDLGKTCELQ
ncbi:L-glutamine:scyllo-inosose aminotransferase [bacterium BMS3Bbin04]|nr:L-glutamine:scyllo-inosose aminotransferase [bacterium BMS3Bbin04]